MDEILEKLRIKTPGKKAIELPEPITARVSRENGQRKRPISPPELNYRSPQVISHFCLKTSKAKMGNHVCAWSMERAANEILMKKSATQPLLHSKELIKSDLNELKLLNDHWKKASPSEGFIKILPYEQTQTIYESITLFKSPTMFKTLLRSVPKNYRLHPNGFTVTHYICEQGNILMLEEVDKHSDNLDFQSKAGLTPLMLAAGRGNIDCLFYLIKRGCDLYKKDFVYGWTCLHHAVNNNQYEIIRFLVKDCKAKIGVKDFSGRDAMDLAKNKSFLMIYRFFQGCIKGDPSWMLNY